MKYMSSKVFYANTNNQKFTDDILIKLLEKTKFIDNLDENDMVALKTHLNQKNEMNPSYIRKLVDTLKNKNTKPFLTDTRRLHQNSMDKLETAIKENFDYSRVNCPTVIADGLTGHNEYEVEINEEIFSSVKIAGDIHESDALIVMSNIKAHPLIGVGGAIKNLAIECASYSGKKKIYKQAPPFIVKIRCLACRECKEACPENAISIDGYAKIDYDKCIGCNDCIESCPAHTIKLNIMNSEEFIEAIVEYASGTICNKKYNKVVYINFLTNITPDYDYTGFNDNPIVDDIGILISYDPVAIDYASYDLVNNQVGNHDCALLSNYDECEDKFKGIRPNINTELQLKKAEKLRLGNMDYELIEIM